MCVLVYTNIKVNHRIKYQADPTTLNCDFERDFCHWIIKAETEFEWVARTGNEILELEINGPSEVTTFKLNYNHEKAFWTMTKVQLVNVK